MVKKRKKLDEFLQSRKLGAEASLEQSTRLSNRLFRIAVGAVVVLGLVALVDPPTVTSVVGLALLFGVVVALGCFTAVRFCGRRVFRGPANFNQFIFLVIASVLSFKSHLALGWSPYLAPVPLYAMVLGLAYPAAPALLTSIGLAFYCALLVPPDDASTAFATGLPAVHLPLALILSIGGIIAALGVARVRQQSRPVIVGFYGGIVQALAVVCIEMLGTDFSIARFQDPDLLRDPGYAFAGGVICGGILTSLLPAVELFFGVVTERRLLQLADPSNKLLQVLRERAPGTFQHTLGVQQLARNAAEAIGADVLLTDVGAYYHDIGKIYKPEYFVENMSEDKTIHDRLRPSMSKMIIISHVKDGVVLAKEEKLPDRIIDMIPMHHGTTVVEFFYRKARRESGEEELPGEDVSYRYPGPKPGFAEAGILMLADAVEAIAKTIQEPTSNRFQDMARAIIMKRLEDGQLDECNLTIADLRKIEDSFVRTLTNMYHGRIDYNKSDAPTSTTGSGRFAKPAEKSNGRGGEAAPTTESARGVRAP